MEHKNSNMFRQVLSMCLCVAMLMSMLVLPVAATEPADPIGETINAESTEPQTEETTAGEESEAAQTTPADETDTAVSDETQSGDVTDAAEPTEAATEETEPVDTAVTEVIAMIDALPSSADVESYMAAYDAADDLEGLEGYLKDIQPEIKAAHAAYEALTDEQKAQVTNADKLMELEWIWSMETYETTTFDASARADDVDVVEGDGITFQLFNYSPHINKIITGENGDGTPIYAWDPIVRHFSFRGSAPREGTDANGAVDSNGRPVEVPIAGSTDKNGTAIPGLSSSGYNTTFDADGFTKNHATLKKTLDANGIPYLDLKHNAVGEAKTWVEFDTSNFPENGYYSLGFIFDPDTEHHAVSAYSPENTLLIKSGSNHYTYNSKFNAVDYDTAANLFRVRNYVERNSATASYDGYNDFLPFNYTGGKTVNASGTLDGGSLTGDADTDSGKYSILANDVDYWFGMTMEVEFYQTKDGILLGDDGQTMEDMIFKFSGDDDVWVFVDDVLVLDLGGTHGTVDGTINFATGEVKQYLSWGEADESSSGTSRPTTLYDCFVAAGQVGEADEWKATTNKPNETSADGTDPNPDNNKIFADYTKHTLKFFYLERGAAVANCSLDFRLPTLPDKSLTVGKELTVTGESTAEEALAVQNSLSYQFRVWQAQQNEDGSYAKSDVLFIKPGTEYDILESGTKIGTGTVNAQGLFSLRAGQQAQFTEMLVKGEGVTHYVVEEILPEELAGQYDSVEYVVDNNVSGTTQPEGGEETNFTSFISGASSAEESQLVTFRNVVKIENLGTLKITKEKKDGAYFGNNAEFNIQVKLGGVLVPVGTSYDVYKDGTKTETCTVATPGIVTLAIDETAVFEKSILSGTEYEITEVVPAGAQYKPTYSGTVSVSSGEVPDGYGLTASATDVTGSFPLGGTVEVTVTNENFDFSGSIPITKTALGNSVSTAFRFDVDQVEKDTWNVLKENAAGVTITVDGSEPTTDSATIAFANDAADDTYYYRVTEIAGSGSYIYDTNFYIVAVKVETVDESRSARIVEILRNGTEVCDAVTFTNQKTTSVIVNKYVLGIQSDSSFSFTATVDGVDDCEFVLNDRESYTISGIPVGSAVVVKETPVDGYAAYYKVGTSGNASAYDNENGVSVTAAETATYVNFYNARYTVDDTVVIDYGLSVDVDVLTNDVFPSAPASVGLENGTGKFGTASVVDSMLVRYTPNSMQMDEEDVFTYTVPFTTQGVEDTFQGTLTVIPATTIYYEDTFTTISYATYDYETHFETPIATSWTPVTDSTVITDTTQDTHRPGDVTENIDPDHVYGYDSAYTACAQYSMGTAQMVTVDLNTFAEATFSFTGTGFDVISLTSNTSGTILGDVYAADGYKRLESTALHSYLVDTYYGYAYGDHDNNAETPAEWYPVDSNSSNALYQVPVMKVEGLDYGSYTAVITVAYDDMFAHGQLDGTKYEFYLDAIRIYDPANDGAGNQVIEDAYVADGEGWPSYTELRNELIDAETFDALGESDTINGVIFIDGIPALDDTTATTTAAITDYQNYGPNNELYLAKGQAVSFDLEVTGDVANIHLALKSVGGTAQAAVYGLDDAGRKTEVVVGNDGAISTATDLYYDITDLNNKTVVIASSGDAILSITNIKTTYNADPSSAGTFSLRMSRSSAALALASLAVEEEPVVFTPEKLDVYLSDNSVKVGSRVMVMVTTKTDVESIVVNGQVCTSYSYNRWTGNRIWTVWLTAESVGDMAVSVAACSADGVVSEEVVKNVTVTKNYTSVGDWLKDIIGGLIGRRP